MNGKMKIKEWIERHISLTLTVILTFVLILIGLYIYWTMTDALRNHPEITEIEIFAPPRLDLMLATVFIISLFCSLALKFGKPYEEEINEDKGKT